MDVISYIMDVDINMINICLAQYAYDEHDLQMWLVTPLLKRNHAKICTEHTQAEHNKCFTSTEQENVQSR